MRYVAVRPHKWKNKWVGKSRRKVRPASKRKIIGDKPKKLWPIYDEYRQFKGWSSTPPKK